MENDQAFFHDNDDFRRVIKRARLTRHWTQADLARHIGCSVDIVKRWEAGTRGFSLTSRRRLCETFELELAAFCSENLPIQEENSSPENQREKLHRRAALTRINVTWIEGVLREKVKPAKLLTLGLETRPDLLANPWAHDVPETRVPAQALANTSLLEVYDQTGGGVLLLGEGCSGKTTLTLELLRILLKRAFQRLNQPLPLFFPLASWANRQAPLAEWLMEEMETRYEVSSSVGQAWLEQGRLILLLDGLDEVDPAYREACITAINAFGRAFHAPVVLNSRLTDYTELAVRAELFTAVVVQPLSDTQIAEYLAAAHISRQEAHKALADDPGLLEMVRSPMMLSILTQMYKEGKVETDIRLTGTPEERRRQALVRYVHHLFTRRKAGRYDWKHTQQWLSYLASQMQLHNQVQFNVERLQPDWLPEGRARIRYQHIAIRLIYGLQISLVGMLFAWIRGGARMGNSPHDGVSTGLFGLLGAGPGNTVLSWMAKGFGGGVEGGGSFCILLTLVFILLPLLLGSQKHAPLSIQRVKQGLLKGVSTGLKTFVILVLVGIPLFGMQGGLAHGLQYSLGAALFCGLMLALTAGVIITFGDPSPGQLSKQRRFSRCVDAVIVSVCAGICFGLVDLALHLKFSSVLLYSIMAMVYFVVALTIGGALGLLRGVGIEIQPSERVSWTLKSIRSLLGHHLVKGAIIGLSLTVLMSTVLASCSAVFYGWNYGARYGLIYGLIIGLSGGFVAALGGVLNTIWLSDLLEIKQLVRPNEGIHRTLINAFLAAAMCGPLGGIISGLISGAAFGWLGGLSGWGIVAGGLMVIWIVLFSFEFWLIYGGQAWIQHYLLRFALWRMGVMPLDAVSFLDFAAERLLLYKVQGGYIFLHRVVADYFAGLPTGEQVAPSEENGPSR